MVTPPPNSVHPKTRAAWRAWLTRHYGRAGGVWLIRFKKATGKQRFEYSEAVEEALCFGWIDSKPGKLDAERTMVWFAPRKAGSAWSKINRMRVENMIEEGRMSASGMEKVDAARRDGAWSALDEVDAIMIPPDLARAFRGHASAESNFHAFPSFTKRAILDWIRIAKRPETRAGRIEETARLAGQNVRANQWRPS